MKAKEDTDPEREPWLTIERSFGLPRVEQPVSMGNRGISSLFFIRVGARRGTYFFIALRHPPILPAVLGYQLRYVLRDLLHGVVRPLKLYPTHEAKAHHVRSAAGFSNMEKGKRGLPRKDRNVLKKSESFSAYLVFEIPAWLMAVIMRESRNSTHWTG
jgi:hypothetical protein